MFRIILSCNGVPTREGEEAAIDIAKEFAEHRQWHRNVKCTWDGRELVLEAENEVDETGFALQDEFSDCISACVTSPFDGEIKIISVTGI